ncbi:hypothetical protein KUTeg_012997 [Tegillarca granosa]|uniref:G-protein coupled receptors family 1 profile domain-containing protein n=1 Tax=Tegillarca granosa TaxID=220873 RepID=A0ABQ9ESE5_TEGGR|nr:hypothetical protein KUTeg_012997 [Tegillarca granosa]
MSLARNSQLSVEISVARTLAAVVMTDFFCWFPVGAMGIMSLFSVNIPSGVYAWVIVFVLPINSALNPILYTFTKMKKKRASSMANSSRPVTETEKLKSSVIPLQLHQSIIKKFDPNDVSIQTYLQQAGYEWKHVYTVCWFIIKELRLLHANDITHGKLTGR